jgi:hypothetical protein
MCVHACARVVYRPPSPIKPNVDSSGKRAGQASQTSSPKKSSGGASKDGRGEGGGGEAKGRGVKKSVWDDSEEEEEREASNTKPHLTSPTKGQPELNPKT